MFKHYSYEIAYITDQGNVRDKNQDSLLIRRGSVGKREVALLAVADGMGGLSRGEEASACAVMMLDDWWENHLLDIAEKGMKWEKIEGSLTDLVEKINWQIYSTNSTNEKSGTTISFVLLFDDEYLFFQVGDSRIYLLKKNQFYQLTHDQTWCQREIAAGRLTEAEAERHPMRHVLLSTLGVTKEYTLEKAHGHLMLGESLLLCSDGFYKELSMDQLLQKTTVHNSLQEKLEDVRTTILQGKAADNLTAIWIKMVKIWR